MGVKIRKEDSARIHGDHLRYKGRRSVFPPLYLSPPRAPSSAVLYIYVYVDVQVQCIRVHTYPRSWIYISSTRYIEINVYIQVHNARIRIRVSQTRVLHCIKSVNVQRLISTGDRKFSTKGSRKIFHFPRPRRKVDAAKLTSRASRFFQAPHLDDALITFRASRAIAFKSLFSMLPSA